MKTRLLLMLLAISVASLGGCKSKDKDAGVQAETVTEAAAEDDSTVEDTDIDDVIETEVEELSEEEIKELQDFYNPDNAYDFTGLYLNDNGDTIEFEKTEVQNMYRVTADIVDCGLYIGGGNWVDGGVEIAFASEDSQPVYAVFFIEDNGEGILRITQSEDEQLSEQTDIGGFAVEEYYTPVTESYEDTSGYTVTYNPEEFEIYDSGYDNGTKTFRCVVDENAKPNENYVNIEYVTEYTVDELVQGIMLQNDGADGLYTDALIFGIGDYEGNVVSFKPEEDVRMQFVLIPYKDGVVKIEACGHIYDDEDMSYKVNGAFENFMYGIVLP